MQTTYTWAVTGMHCNSCSILIDEAVEELDGVTSSTTSLKKKLTTVTLDPTRCEPAHVAEAIRIAGYDVNPVSVSAQAAPARRAWFRRARS
ncbi:heavy-metal-associated domain-containing protein [Nocardioides sp. NPDC057767]|uniref:Copper chaperone CopZ n=1 Tax=Nocardioides albertanoniae TaxID=1175486 RepID=A0A543A3S1_9ACTN|nr:heavy-metal-associated domain-containing protein [Nocardioides albertanoniae]TQL67229.1 copper chaperone CopZ [Nocardioides albertanoniae]